MPIEKENKRFKDYQTEKRIHEHLSNENDHISEEDIKNVKTDFNVEGSIDSINRPDEEKLTGNDKDEKGENSKTEATQDPGIETSWNLLK